MLACNSKTISSEIKFAAAHYPEWPAALGRKTVHESVVPRSHANSMALGHVCPNSLKADAKHQSFNFHQDRSCPSTVQTTQTNSLVTLNHEEVVGSGGWWGRGRIPRQTSCPTSCYFRIVMTTHARTHLRVNSHAWTHTYMHGKNDPTK